MIDLAVAFVLLGPDFPFHAQARLLVFAVLAVSLWWEFITLVRTLRAAQAGAGE